MKNLIVLVALIMFTLSAFAQSPQNINYQAVVRNNTGDVIKNQSVRFRLSITEGLNGVTTYSETNTTPTNGLGLVNLTIGAGTVTTGTFAAINWASGEKFLKIEVDATGGINYALMGSQQFASVPYALHAQSATNAWTLNGNNTTSNNTLGTTNAQDLRLVTNNAVNAVLKSNGQFGLGTTNPSGWLTIEKNANGSNFDDDRNFIILRDKSSTDVSTAVMRIYSGQSGTFTALNHHASSYFLNDFADHGQLWASGKGLILRAGPTSASFPNNSSIKFMTGFRADGGSNERMIITPRGNVGINSSNPISKLSIEGDESGDVPSGTPDPRRYMYFKNSSSDLGSVVYASLEAGPSGNQTSLAHHSSTYFFSNLADYGQVMSTGRGLVLRAFPKNNNGSDGVIKFMTGVTPEGGNSIERMRISVDGKVGIGTEVPVAKLEVKDGDVYVNDATKGIILKSPNGNCWRVTMDNTGNFVRTTITCPN